MFNFLASTDGPHISLAPEAITEVGGITITNSIIYGAIVALFVAVLMVVAARRMTVKPKRGLTTIVELLVEFLVDMLEKTLGSRGKAVTYAPYFGTFFIFIVASNLLGLLPIVGPGVYAETAAGHTPLFRPFTADLNGTIAMAIIGIVLVQIASIRESGWLGHLQHYFTDKPLNPINFFIGLLEVFGEFTRVLSLSLRLFLNTAVGEILISVFAFIGKDASSFTLVPIVMFEMMVALIQAYVFTVLCATYLGLAIAHGHEHEEHESDHQHAPGLKAVQETAS